MNIDVRKRAKDDCEKYFFELMIEKLWKMWEKIEV